MTNTTSYGTRNNKHPRMTNAFTLIELLVVTGIIAILAALLLPALAKAKAKAQSIYCLNNLKQLQFAYLAYVHDNNDRLPNQLISEASGVQLSLKGSWVVGNAKRDTNSWNIEAGVIFPYVGQTAVYRCPADYSKVTGQNALLRFRSYSFDGWVNSGDKGSAYGGSFDWTKSSRPTRLCNYSQSSLSQLFGFIDENEQAIDDGTFFSLNSFTDTTGASSYWYDLPADRHSCGASLSFLDGHAEHWRWKSSKTFRGYEMPPANKLDKEDMHRLHACLPREAF